MAIATTSERYELVRRVRIASFFQSYEAMHPRRPGRFMLDVFTGMDTSAARPRAFLRDAARVSALRHPHILQMLELSSMPDGTPIVVSELPPGQTLEAWLAAGHVPSVRTVIKWIGALAEAVDAAHDAGVVHGAIRADQVFLVEGTSGSLGLPKLKGFGLEWLRSPPAAQLGPSAQQGDDHDHDHDDHDEEEEDEQQDEVQDEGHRRAERVAGAPVPMLREGWFPELRDRAGTVGGVAVDLAALGALAEHLLRLSQAAGIGTAPEEALGLPVLVQLALARASGDGGAPVYESAAELARDLEAAALGPPFDPEPTHVQTWPSPGVRRMDAGAGAGARTRARARARGRSALVTVGVASFVVVCGVSTSSMLEGRRSVASSARATLDARAGSTVAAATSTEARAVQPPAPAGTSGTQSGSPRSFRLLIAGDLSTPPPSATRAASSVAASPMPTAEPLRMAAPAPGPAPAPASPWSSPGQAQHPHGRRGIVWSPGLGRLADVGEITTAFAGDGAEAVPAALDRGRLVP
jgi:serine/threonine-protein kinase